jgi:hypothetical protein
MTAAIMLDTKSRSVGLAWIGLCLALGLHVFDEANTGFLDVYNPTVIALRQKLGWWPMPTFSYEGWLNGLIVGCVLLLLVSIPFFLGVRWLRVPAGIFAFLMLLNAAGHMLFTILGHTVTSVRFPRPAPGFWSSPFLAAASIYFLVQVFRSYKAPLTASTSAGQT